MAGRRSLCRLRRRHRPRHLRRRWSMEVRNRLGRQRRRHQPRWHRHSLVAEALRRHQLQQQGLDDPAQWSRCFSQRKLHLLHLRRSDKPARQTDYGGTSFAAPMWAAYIALVNQQLASNGQAAHRLHQPHHLRAERNLQLRRRLPRHHQRHLRQLFCRHRLRPRHRLGQPERRPDGCSYRRHTNRRLQPLRLPFLRFGSAGKHSDKFHIGQHYRRL